MNKTNIEYLDHTWNPIAMRCTPESEGCANCWHLQMANRLCKNPKLPECVRRAYAHMDDSLLLPEELDAPMKKKGNLRIGVQFMGDLFHPRVTDKQRDKVFQAMWAAELCGLHTFLILTKLPGQMLEFMKKTEFWNKPLNNLWIGVTVENQRRADERIPILLQIPAAVRFVSVEPMLGPVDLGAWLPGCYECAITCGYRLPDGAAKMMRCPQCCFEGEEGYDAWGNGPVEICPECGYDDPEYICPNCNGHMVQYHPDTPNLSWVICGGESGHGARPMHPDWVRSLRDQCKAAGVPFMFKQWGEWEPVGPLYSGNRTDEEEERWANEYGRRESIYPNGSFCDPEFQPRPDAYLVERVGKHKAGRLLDGQEWLQYPEVRCIK